MKTIPLTSTQSPPPLTVGLDVGDKHVHIAALDDTGTVVVRDRVTTSRKAVTAWFQGRNVGRVALEVGRHSPWLSRLLQGLGLKVYVANPRKVALVYAADDKCDRVDAEVLARLARVDPHLLAPIQHRRKDTQAALALLRARAAAVRARTMLINSVRGQVRAMGGCLSPCSSSRFASLVTELPEELELAMSPLMSSIASLSVNIRHYDQVVEDLCRDVYPETRLLRAVDGIGALTSLAYVLTLEDPARFRRSRDVGSYLGLRPRRDQSGEVDKQLRITKAGDKMLRTLLVQCAHRILGVFGRESDLRTWGLKLAARGGSSAKK